LHLHRNSKAVLKDSRVRAMLFVKNDQAEDQRCYFFSMYKKLTKVAKYKICNLVI